MKKASGAALCAVVVVVVAVLLCEAPLTAKAAVTCNPLELSSCLPAITSSAQPSTTCCGKLREQRPCLCGYIKNPNLKQYVGSPGAKKVASTCGVSIPRC
ncbi:non-specific lipid-transfer protein 2-like [Corylus avellana]|uniref:non-specific lipid-transfer protein 2-like n=1 Tax=Corylus avellana TaxID=13451 RepID=UPI001E21FE5E|nr:non-specific lipid-transfer protein 2-like [Corylus avellana]